MKNFDHFLKVCRNKSLVIIIQTLKILESAIQINIPSWTIQIIISFCYFCSQIICTLETAMKISYLPLQPLCQRQQRPQGRWEWKGLRKQTFEARVRARARFWQQLKRPRYGLRGTQDRGNLLGFYYTLFIFGNISWLTLSNTSEGGIQGQTKIWMYLMILSRDHPDTSWFPRPLIHVWGKGRSLQSDISSAF